ncbi:MAG TPA: hypothetical protein VJW77_06570 [Terriglobia bacterium]|nr:hypothetical protein [Terriglobia bacterium]
MDNAIAESPDRPSKDRSGWLVAFGVVEILLGAAILLMSLFALASLLISRPSHAAEMPAGVHMAGIAFLVGFYVVIAAYFVVAGIGSILRRNWARILTLAGSSIWLLFGILGTLFSLFLFPKIMAVRQPVPPAAQHIEAIVLGTMVLMSIVFGILLPLTFLIFYSRKSVKATCRAREGTPATAAASSNKLPVPVIILVVWESFAAVSSCVVLFSPLHVTSLFGYIVRGWPVVALMLVFSVLSAAAAWLIYRKRLAGWTIAVCKLLFFAASAGVSLATGSMSRLFAEVSQTRAQQQFAQLFPHFINMIMITSLILCAVYLALLTYSRRFFPPAQRPQTA